MQNVIYSMVCMSIQSMQVHVSIYMYLCIVLLAKLIREISYQVDASAVSDVPHGNGQDV